MGTIKKLFSIEQTKTHNIYRIFGIKIAFYDKKREFAETDASKYIQDSLDLSGLQNSKKVVVFFVPYETKICGGIMSIFSLCQTTRKICPDSFCAISTFPNGKTYVINDKFHNNEKVLRFEQIVNNAKNVEELILHIPEYFAGDFYNSLNEKDIAFLKSVRNLQINILNQNIEIMPDCDKLQGLYKLTDNVTQTIAHDRYATQEVCDKWQMPTHFFSAYWDMSSYRSYSFEEKEKIIVLSPDTNENKSNIVSKLENEFKDWKIVTVNNLTFSQYMDLISRAFFVITFGEGFDGYFVQPPKVNGIGFAVYNDNFFPNSKWLDMPNVFKSYEDMENNIVDVFKNLSTNKELYCNLSKLNNQKQNELYSAEQYEDNLKRFYQKKYDFLPLKEKNK